MCPQCLGHGQLKKEYGYRVMYEPCEHCDGSGLLGFKRASLRPSQPDSPPVTEPPPAVEPLWMAEWRIKVKRIEKFVEDTEVS